MTDYDEIAWQIRLLRSRSVPRSARGRRWRWDLTPYRIVEGGHFPGVRDGRKHIGGACGYTFTKWGALLQIAREHDKYVRILLGATATSTPVQQAADPHEGQDWDWGNER